MTISKPTANKFIGTHRRPNNAGRDGVLLDTPKAIRVKKEIF